MKKSTRRTTHIRAKILSFSLTLAMVAGSLAGLFVSTPTEVYAKEIGKKNEAALDRVDAVLAGETPSLKDYSSTAAGNPGVHDDRLSGVSYTDGYSENALQYESVLGSEDKSVFRGGNSLSILQNGTYIDHDITDFTSVLPYGTVFIDTSKLNFREENSGNFLVDIQDSRFAWAANHNAVTPGSQNAEDAEGHKPTIITGYNSADGSGGKNVDASSGIVYRGGLTAYLSNTPAYQATQKGTDGLPVNYDWLYRNQTEDGYQNVITPENGGYLYRLVFYDAVILPDGTKGDLEVKTTKLTIESSIDIKNVIIGIQDANKLQVGPSINVLWDKDQDPDRPKWMDSDDSVEDRLEEEASKVGTDDNRGAADRYSYPLTVSTSNGNITTAVGTQTEIEIVVRNKEGKAVSGEISYSMTDLDIQTYQSYWGRPSNTWANSDHPGYGTPDALMADNMYAEGVTITGGSLSYAVTPRYEHHEVGIGPNQGEILSAGWNPAYTTPLWAERVANGAYANGVRFRTSNAHSRRNFAGVYGTTTDIPNGCFSESQRNDGGSRGSFDSGFATLLNPEKTTMTWTGSITTNLSTKLFDTSTFTHVEQSHGTGGGTYFETYQIVEEGDELISKLVRNEGVTTMGKGDDVTVTVVPEDGYRVRQIVVGSAGMEEKLNTYTISELTFTDGKYEDTENGIVIEQNPDRSYDVTILKIDEPRHVHADFECDYYFYKVWKNPGNESIEIPDKLDLKATPFVFEMKEVEIDGVKYTISEQGSVFTNSETGKEYVLNKFLELSMGEGKVYKLEGNKLVKGTGDDREEYEITIGVTSGTAKSFTVNKTDPGVTVETKDGNEVWKIKYPSGGDPDATVAWPELPAETNTTDEYNKNHIERNMWFVTEEAVPGWAIAGYDNSAAEVPGSVSAEDSYSDADGVMEAYWRIQAEMFHGAIEDLMEEQGENTHAIMSPLSGDITGADGTTEYTGWGGGINNTPFMRVNVEKKWAGDSDNLFETRQDILFHLDATINGVKTYDYMPPILIAADATGNDLKGSWGDQSVYETADPNIEILADSSSFVYNKDGVEISYEPMADGVGYQGSDGKLYYVNELTSYDKDGNKIEFSVRETSARPRSGGGYEDEIIGYTKDTSKLENLTDGTVTVDGVKIPAKNGEATNTLQVVDFTVTKIWKENGGDRKHTAAELAADGAALKSAYTIKEFDEALTSDAYKPTTAAAYNATSKTGTLEVKVGDAVDGNATTVFIWHNIPKYALEKDGTGNVTGGHEAVYSIVETKLNGYNAPIFSSTDKAFDKGTITNEVTPPEGEDRETYGKKGTPQSTNGSDMFTTTTDTQLDGSKNEIETIKLIDPETGDPVDRVTVPEGTYTFSPDTGVITFTPKDSDYVGDPTPVTVQGTDSNGLTGTAVYQPHVKDDTKTVTRTIVYEYSNGDPVLDEEGKPKTVIQTVTFGGDIDPNTGEVVYPVDPSQTMPAVPSDTIKDYTPDRDRVDELTVHPYDSDTTIKVIYSPGDVTAKPDETYGLPGQSQTGTPTFKPGTPTYTDGTPNEITVSLVDPKTGKPTDKKTVTIDGRGSYTLNDDGTITFTPEDGYVGNPDPIEVTGVDKFGTTAVTTYTPHIVDPIDQETATRTIYYTYVTADGDPVTGDDGEPYIVEQTVTLTRHASEVNPKTGAVRKWGSWEPQTFPAVDNPDNLVDLKIWTADSSAGELTVKKPGAVSDEHVIYQKEPYSVTYTDGEHGKSDGNGDQEGEDYGSEVTGGNGVTPDPGYHFTVEYEYVITDKDGNVIETGTTDDPTSLIITGNIVFTPIYNPNQYTIKYDANGGIGEMSDQSFTGEDKEAVSKENEFTRDGYRFEGFKARDKDGNYLKDGDGNDIIITGPYNLIDYLHEQGDGGEIILEAQWKKLPTVTYTDPATGRVFVIPVPFDGTEPPAPEDPTREGYIFDGWDRTVDEDGNVTYTAKWIPVDTGGNEPDPEPEPEPTTSDEPEPTTTDTTEQGTGTNDTDGNDTEPTTSNTAEQGTAAKTGDQTNGILWITLVCTALCAMFTGIIFRKKSKR